MFRVFGEEKWNTCRLTGANLRSTLGVDVSLKNTLK